MRTHTGKLCLLQALPTRLRSPALRRTGGLKKILIFFLERISNL